MIANSFYAGRGGSGDFELDQPINLGDPARAWPINARAAWFRRFFLFIGFSVPESSKSLTVLALPRSEEVLAEKLGLHGGHGMVTIDKINLNWQIRHYSYC